jgi:hypothetical protein
MLAFSHDAAQKYLLVADGENSAVWIVRRTDGAVVSSFGHSGRNAGQFHCAEIHAAGQREALNRSRRALASPLIDWLSA